MDKIKILPPHIANKIAAGEVVDRPASVVKELVENAIDAQADQITIIISEAGKELIQVIDNGTGMTEEDAILAFERHATSKISNVQDLERILTLGFRGEALPSIASVSRVELKTFRKDSQVGTLFKINGGTIDTVEKLAFKPGTTISVKNLFFNTPARRNFLRADSTEFNHILKWAKRFFLAHPKIHFSLIHNGEELFNLERAPLSERIAQVFGLKYYQGLVHVCEELNQMLLDGYVCRPDQARRNTANQFIFLNRRIIVNRSLSHAVFQGYGNLMERYRYPQFIFNLEIPPDMVDVNVHPTKMEVRFANDKVVYNLFLSAVRTAIQTKNIIPAFDMETKSAHRVDISKEFPRTSNPFQGAKVIQQSSASRPEDNPAFIDPRKKHSNPSQTSFSYQPMPPKPQSESHIPQKRLSEEDSKFAQAPLWQVHNRYIFSQIKSGLVIIDQHVAHERVLYEQILNNLNKGKRISSQQLLFPQTLDLVLEDYLIFTDIKEELSQIGFVIAELSGRSIVIEAIPSDVRVSAETKILLEIIDFYRENEGATFKPHEKIAAAFACKSAIKSGEKLSAEAMNVLVNQLFLTKEPYFSPHGRPVIVTLDLPDLDRKFKRK